ncbi:hypothetical protein [Consotaella aegiceratis]|uniref:hypothetical protein n=1 Tax=Consotaella aegiceratis TaxID=3097961 RepID=UPI002F3E486F
MWPRIVGQLAEALPNLWEHRDRIVATPTARLADLMRFDERIAAQLEALAIEGGAAIALCDDCWRMNRPGESFARTATALLRGDELPPLPGDASHLRARASAFGFVPADCARRGLDSLISGGGPVAAEVASRAMRIMRISHATLGFPIPPYKSALLAPAMCGERRAVPALAALRDHPQVGLFADAALFVLMRLLPDLAAFLSRATAAEADLADTLIRLAPQDDALELIRADGAVRDVAVAVAVRGALGRPSDAEALASLAAYPQIRDAARLARQRIVGEADAAPSGDRWLAGGPATSERARALLMTAPQCVRWAAAGELLRDGGPWFDIAAPAQEQRRRLILGDMLERTEAVHDDLSIAI